MKQFLLETRNLKTWLISISFWFFSLGLFAQGGNSSGPWTGDWLPADTDGMVQGESFRGYPGPLVKYFLANGFDAEHPSIYFEQRYILDRSAPHWYGQCQGWAAAAIKYPEPKGTLINGVWFFEPELKAFLSTIEKDISVAPLAGSLGTPTGGESNISPDDLLNALSLTVDQGDAVIFDIGTDGEHWNYPVDAYEHYAVAGTADEYEFRVRFVSPTIMKHQKEENDYFFEAFRYRVLNNGSKEWITADVPLLIWNSGLPYQPGSWWLSGNRFLNYQTISPFLSPSSTAKIDLYEPNDSHEYASQFRTQPLLGYVEGEDIDVFKSEFQQGESIDIAMGLNSGTAFNFSIVDEMGTEYDNVTVFDSFELNWTAPIPGTFFFQIQAQHGPDASYQLVFDQSMGFYDPSNLMELGTEIEFQHILLNIGKEDATAGPFATIPINGSSQNDMQGGLSSRTQHSRVGHATQWWVGGQPYKEYHSRHVKQQRLFFPHISFKNGWDTKLFLKTEATISEAELVVWGDDGDELGVLKLPLNEGFFWGSLGEVLGYSGRHIASHFEIRLPAFAVAEGFIQMDRLENVGDSVRFPLRGAPIFGETFMMDLPVASEGWTGFAMVNRSGQENEILFRLFNGVGQMKESGAFTLAPNQKKLSTVASFVSSPLEEGDFIRFFSHYEIESMSIVHRYGDEPETYGSRGQSLLLDYHDNLWVKYDPEYADQSFFLVENTTNRFFHVLFEAYDSNGELLGRYNAALGAPHRPFSSEKVPFNQIFENGYTYGDLSTCTHIKLTLPEQVFAREQLIIEDQILTTPLLNAFVDGIQDTVSKKNIQFEVKN